MKRKKKMPPEMVDQMVDRLRALGDPARLRILLRLRDGECNVTTLVEELEIAQASVSKHLSTLRRNGILKVQRIGAHAVYSIKDESVFEVLRIVCDSVCRDHAELSAAIGVRGPSFDI